MLICRVVGSVVSTRKNEMLIGSKFMVVEHLGQNEKQPSGKAGKEPTAGRFVAVDNIGAGIGEAVLVVFGSAARVACGSENVPVDAAIVGIID
jgi:ethanolamine utilization protein EutN